MSSGNVLNSPDVLANPVIAGLLSERAREVAELEKQRANHHEGYPAVQQLKAQVDVIDTQIQNVAKSIRASVKQQYDAAVQAENSRKQQVAALVDGVVIVIRSDRSRRGSLKASLRRLRNMRTNILGGVLTDFDPTDMGNRYSEYYGYNYHQYSNNPAR
jgi:hypothetical protein